MNTADSLDQAKAALQQGQLGTARDLLERLIAKAPDNKDAFYLLAVTQRYMQQPDAALATLERLSMLRPGYGHDWQERGHCFLAKGEVLAAINAFGRAVQANPALLASWRALRELGASMNDSALIREADEEIAALSAMAPPLRAIAVMIHDGELDQAEKLCRNILQRDKRNVEAMRLLARIGLHMRVLDDADYLLESALVFDPSHFGARLDHVRVLLQRQKFASALEAAEIACAARPESGAARSLRADALAAVGRNEDAIAVYDQLIAEHRSAPANALMRGHAQKTIGQQGAAIESYRLASQLRPDLGDAWWSLANLKTYHFTDDEIETMQAMLASPETAPPDRYRLAFALGKAFEGRKDHEAAFTHYQIGNAGKRAELDYEAEGMQRAFDLQKSLLTADFFAERQDHGASSPDPIFIVGLPRAGSTLIEQILASHSQIDGTLELPNIMAFAQELGGTRKNGKGPRYPDVLADLDARQTRELGKRFLRETQVFRQGAPFFTDKMPNNFRHIGLIQLILPNAKIIDARRDPLDCCFSCYRQLFAEGQNFSYDLSDIGAYYRGYVDLMAHWDKVLPGKILRVQHEELIADTEAQVRRMLDFLRLEFEPACLDFHRNKRAVRTASSEQVRRPINRDGVGQWRPYKQWLEPLFEALGPELASS
ncbi:tetratricopeptide repeat-containing sulfotransferase family protein [Pedomonas mirosovicensis]|uniref:tetratricopeptide repeat-containing sulfotransferase family protein n=1 Tax=Pedomonas mirosovicensis TaxID=2908641 RepID=UPI0021689B17|nr:tetratricopeptide repeat-containing sulfotransferase family protein [Pedomonas mirosovicensis]MCH8686529.1 sulfotransferase [Pedomonas mirosovicensis]